MNWFTAQHSDGDGAHCSCITQLSCVMPLGQWLLKLCFSSTQLIHKMQDRSHLLRAYLLPRSSSLSSSAPRAAGERSTTSRGAATDRSSNITRHKDGRHSSLIQVHSDTVKRTITTGVTTKRSYVCDAVLTQYYTRTIHMVQYYTVIMRCSTTTQGLLIGCNVSTTQVLCI